ncbi:MAG: FAD-binding oxidoreductase [Anaerolineales bacterium]|nr:FAD-binding oxidoreductase [Anaerolineales bacterium]
MESADVVVIGGGVLGGAVAFYLAKQDAGRVILLERDAVAQGNSSLAAGLLTCGRFKSHLIPMVVETYKAIEEIEGITGESLGLRQTGCLYAAVSPANQKEIRTLASTSSQAGLKMEWLDSADATHLVPWLKLPRDTSVVFMPDDGYIDGYTLASGYIKSARTLGVEIREQTPVVSIRRDGGRVIGVKTSNGDISASFVIDAAGVWAGMLAREIGIGLPMAPVRSHYWITASHSLFSPQQPFVILPDARAYARPESNRLLFGFREKQSVSVDPRQLPENMNGYIFNQDPNGWESLIEGIPDFGRFLPLIEEIEISNYIKGLSNYTPDGNFVLGEFPALDGFLAATGCAGAGIAMSGGIGRFISDLVAGRAPFVDSTPHRVDRFGEIDSIDSNFIQRCADARSGKITG